MPTMQSVSAARVREEKLIIIFFVKGPLITASNNITSLLYRQRKRVLPMRREDFMQAAQATCQRAGGLMCDFVTDI